MRSKEVSLQVKAKTTENLFTTSSQVWNTLEESVSESTVKDSFMNVTQPKKRPLVEPKNRNLPSSGLRFFGLVKTNLYQNDVREKCGEGKETLQSDMEEAWTCMSANGSGSLLFLDDATADRSSRRTSGRCTDLYSNQITFNVADCPKKHHCSDILILFEEESLCSSQRKYVHRTFNVRQTSSDSKLWIKLKV